MTWYDLHTVLPSHRPPLITLQVCLCSVRITKLCLVKQRWNEEESPMGGEIRATSQSVSLSTSSWDGRSSIWTLGPEFPFFDLVRSPLAAVKRMGTGQLYLIRRGEALQHRGAVIPEWSHDGPFQFHMQMEIKGSSRPSSLDSSWVVCGIVVSVIGLCVPCLCSGGGRASSEGTLHALNWFCA
jgi:hypothetical protein